MSLIMQIRAARGQESHGERRERVLHGYARVQHGLAGRRESEVRARVRQFQGYGGLPQLPGKQSAYLFRMCVFVYILEIKGMP